MINISIVLHKTDVAQITELLHDILNSKKIILNKIYLLDNSPTNELHFIANITDKIEYIYNDKNLGYGKAHNIAMKKSIANKAEYHLVLNPDIRFNDDTLAILIDFMQNNSRAGLVMPNIVNKDGTNQKLCKLLPNPLILFLRRAFPNMRITKKLNYQYCMEWTNYDKAIEVPYLSGSFMLFRTKSLIDIGLFDEQFFMYFEDTDISKRFHTKNMSWFCPDATAIHYHRRESYSNIKLFVIHINSMFLYFKKHRLDYKKINREYLERSYQK